MKKILLIITGSIAAYKSADLIRLLKKNNYDVHPVLTTSAAEFITPLLTSSLSGNKTHIEMFNAENEAEISHIKLSRSADLIVIAPATADFIAKIANGYADDLASTLVLAADTSKQKIIIAPAMNSKMWENQITQNNIEKITQNNFILIEPESDILACGEEGIGKMANTEKIYQKIEDFFINKNLLVGKKILITAGATHEKIDSVRFIGNYSSGKQANLIANHLSEMGAEVKVITGFCQQKFNLSADKITKVKSAEEMFLAVKEDYQNCDVFISCAAVADFRVEKIAENKIKKEQIKSLTLNLVANQDILHFVANSRHRPKMVIGFAAEDQNIVENAEKKLIKKNCDLVIANDINQGEVFGSKNSNAFLIKKNQHQQLGKIKKSEIAKIIGNEIVNFCN
jgi:phosphopantothenoylcysteine decarboxylase/phosphopantothenate--cysteine ligase